MSLTSCFLLLLLLSQLRNHIKISLEGRDHANLQMLCGSMRCRLSRHPARLKCRRASRITTCHFVHSTWDPAAVRSCCAVCDGTHDPVATPSTVICQRQRYRMCCFMCCPTLADAVAIAASYITSHVITSHISSHLISHPLKSYPIS